MKFNIYNNVSYDETLNDKLAWGGDYMEEREEVRDLRGRSELPPSLFSEGFFFPWNEWPEKDRLFLDEPPWLAISNDLTLLFQFLKQEKKKQEYSKHHPQEYSKIPVEHIYTMSDDHFINNRTKERYVKDTKITKSAT